jgi:hypothetical protein
VLGQEPANLGPQLIVPSAGGAQPGLPPGGVDPDGSLVQLADPSPALRRHLSLPPSCPASQASASAKSCSTVATETPSAAATDRRNFVKSSVAAAIAATVSANAAAESGLVSHNRNGGSVRRIALEEHFVMNKRTHMHASDPLVMPVTYGGCPPLVGAIWSWTAETAAHALR